MRLPWEPEAQQLAGEGKGRVVSPRVGGCGEGTGLTHQEECSGVLVEPWVGCSRPLDCLELPNPVAVIQD